MENNQISLDSSRAEAAQASAHLDQLRIENELLKTSEWVLKMKLEQLEKEVAANRAQTVTHPRAFQESGGDSKLEALTAENSVFRSRVEALEKELAETRGKLAQHAKILLEKAYSEAYLGKAAQALQAENEALKANEARLKTLLETLEKKKEVFDTKAYQQSSNFALENIKLDQLTSEVEALKSENQLLKADADLWREKLQHAESDLSALRSKMVEQAKEALERIQGEMDDALSFENLKKANELQKNSEAMFKARIEQLANELSVAKEKTVEQAKGALELIYDLRGRGASSGYQSK